MHLFIVLFVFTLCLDAFFIQLFHKLLPCFNFQAISGCYFLFQLINCFHPFLFSLAGEKRRWQAWEEVWMEEVKAARKLVPSLYGETSWRNSSCSQHYSSGDYWHLRRPTCGILSLQQSILLGENFGECLFQFFRGFILVFSSVWTEMWQEYRHY